VESIQGAARGRHAPPPEVRLPLQRQRLLRAAAAEFAARGFAQASADSISRRAKMSKATFYTHFANKQACMLALFDRASEVVAQSIADAARAAGTTDALARMSAGTRAFLSAVSEHPEFAQTLVVEIVGAGPEALRRRDAAIEAFANVLDAENAAAAARGLSPRFASSTDAVAIVGAIMELVSRHVRLGQPRDVLELAPVIDRMFAGMLAASGV
jgi:AcrR family transcriptional regulator